MAPLVGAALISALPSLLQMFQGGLDKSAAEDLAKTPAPTRQTPPEVLELLRGARERAGMTNTPGLEGYLQGQTAQGVTRLKEVSPSSAALLGGTADIYGRGMDIGAKSRIDYYNKSQAGLVDALGVAGGQTQANWQFNEADPYLRAMAAAGRLNEVGRQNQMSGLTNMATAGSSLLAGDALAEYIKQNPPVVKPKVI